MLQLILACQFLTIVPLTVRRPVAETDVAAAMAWFPLVGLLLGGLAAGLYMVIRPFADSLLSAFVPLVFLVLITGNMHGDGLMDAADGLGSGRPAQQALAIMKDSNVGSHGVMAGCIGFLAKLLLLGALSTRGAVAALILVPALGRWAQVYAARTNPYVRSGGGKGGFTKYVGNRELVWASCTTLAAAFVVMGAAGLAVVVVVFVFAHLAGCYIRKRIGGVTGDTLGALSEVMEIVGLVALLVLARL